jgi:hypothetical protein
LKAALAFTRKEAKRLRDLVPQNNGRPGRKALPIRHEFLQRLAVFGVPQSDRYPLLWAVLHGAEALNHDGQKQ